MSIENTIRVYTDGGCHGNPGPGGWAYVRIAAGQTAERSGAEPATTNNRMELTAVIRALEDVASLSRHELQTVRVITDSQYVRNGITSWIANWERNGWKTAARKPVKNRDLWLSLRELDKQIAPRWDWVKGHAGDPHNERCDALVQEAIAGIK